MHPTGGLEAEVRLLGAFYNKCFDESMFNFVLRKIQVHINFVLKILMMLILIMQHFPFPQ